MNHQNNNNSYDKVNVLCNVSQNLIVIQTITGGGISS